MAITPLHKEKFKKNLFVLAIVIGFMILIWAITVLKITEHGVAIQ